MEALLNLDLYKTLGVSKNATLAEIRSAYRKLVLKCHPDKFQDESLKSLKQAEFQKLQQAYEMLSDANKRQEYDDFLRKVQIREQMSQGKPTPRSNPFEYQVKTPGSPLGSFTSNGNVYMYQSAFEIYTEGARRPRGTDSRKNPPSAERSAGPDFRRSSRGEDVKIEGQKKTKEDENLQNRRKQREDEAKRKKKEEEAKRKKKKEDENLQNRRKQREDEAKRKKKEEEELKRKKREEEEVKRKKREEEANRKKREEEEAKRKLERKKEKERKEKERKRDADASRLRKINIHVEDGSDEEYRSSRSSEKRSAQSNLKGSQSTRKATNKVPMNKKWTEHQDRAGAYLNASLQNSFALGVTKTPPSKPFTPLHGRKPSLKPQTSAPPLFPGLSSRRRAREPSTHINGSPSVSRSQTYIDSRSPTPFDLSHLSLSIPEIPFAPGYNNTLTKSYYRSERECMMASSVGQSSNAQTVLLSSTNIKTLSMNVNYSPQLSQDQIKFATHSYFTNADYR